MRRIPILIALTALALLLGRAHAPAGARAQTPADPRESPPQGAPQPSATRDLSGTYRGVLVFSKTGETIPATLKITGDKFEADIGGNPNSGTIVRLTPGDYSAVEMSFDLPLLSGGGETWTCKLRVSREGGRLQLTPIESKAGSFSFTSSPAGEHGNRNPASADHNAACAGCNANTAANTSANTNSIGRIIGGLNDNGRTAPIERQPPPPLPPSPTPVAARNIEPRLAREARATSPPPTPTPSPSPSPADADADALKAQEAGRQLHDGLLALHAPNEMQQGDTQIITARLTLDDKPDSEARIREGLTGPEATTVQRARVSYRMKVTLIPDDNDAFNIAQQGDSNQFVVPPFAEWRWSVTARSYGKHSLHLVGTPIYKFSDGSEELGRQQTIDQVITIHVSYGYAARNFFSDKDNWKLIFGGVTIPGALAGAWKFWQKRRRRGNGDDDGGDDQTN